MTEEIYAFKCGDVTVKLAFYEGELRFLYIDTVDGNVKVDVMALDLKGVSSELADEILSIAEKLTRKADKVYYVRRYEISEVW